ncbi:hypothetical protein AB0M87_27205 [Streptomyces sp. NPDC051320]|uniref:hypothetical protein n=1 Tax=Streptomyces sp. NPDC051320 TaxID=3154644 RepID=UPI003436A2B1
MTYEPKQPETVKHLTAKSRPERAATAGDRSRPERAATAGDRGRTGAGEPTGHLERTGAGEPTGHLERTGAAEPTGHLERTGAAEPLDHPQPADAASDTPTLLPAGERDRLTLRLQQAVNGFVDSPEQAVEQADRIFEEAVTRMTGTLTERSSALRTAWKGTEQGPATEDLRLLLRDYRALTERLLRL